MLMITPPPHSRHTHTHLHTNLIPLLPFFHINNCHFYLSFFILSLAERHNIESVPKKKIQNKTPIQRNQSELTSQVWERIHMHTYMLAYSSTFPLCNWLFFFSARDIPANKKMVLLSPHHLLNVCLALLKLFFNTSY